MAKPSLIRPCTLVWIILLLLTGVTFYISRMEATGLGIVLFVLVLTLIKSQMVADYFMGLKPVRLLWRGIVFGYLLVVCSLIGVAYYISLP